MAVTFCTEWLIFWPTQYSSHTPVEFSYEFHGFPLSRQQLTNWAVACKGFA